MCVCGGIVSVIWALLFFFFLLQLIRAANNSLLRFHFSSKPLEAECGLQ